MIIFKHPADISSVLLAKRNAGHSTGFVPTMGALHSGHLALVSRARSENQLVICSIFVNPTQFNDPKDFENYPSSVENDILVLEKIGCDVLFIPSVDDIYPKGINSARHYNLGTLENMLEGKYRPGHFQGVCQVVNRLLEIVMPNTLYLGQKDLQQCQVLKKLVTLENIKTEIVICPTLREPDGLAMSSRNLRLNEGDRKKAPAIYKALLSIKNTITLGDTTPFKKEAAGLLMNEGFNVDYVEIVNAATLEIVQKWDGNTPLAALAAAYLNEVRLIDNIILK